MKSYVVDVEVSLHAETEKAWKVSDTGSKEDAVWVPKSETEIEDIGGGVHMLTLPFWMAHDRGLV